MYKIKLPYPTIKKKNSTNLLSANVYRNAHFFQLNKSKKEYAILCFDMFKQEGLEPIEGTVKIEYTLYFKGKRRRDLDNFGYVVSKYCNDALVEYGILEDDDTKVVTEVNFKFGGYAVENYVEVEIIPQN